MAEVSIFFKSVIKKSSSIDEVMNAIREIEGREKKKAAEVATLLTAIEDLTRTVCDLQNQQCATGKTVCDSSATISGAASVTESLVQDGEDHGKKKNHGEFYIGDGVAMDGHDGVQNHIDKNVAMSPESSSPPVIVVPASLLSTINKKREVCKFWQSGTGLPLDPPAKEVHLLIRFCHDIVRLSDELLRNYDVSIWDPERGHTQMGLDSIKKKINFARKVDELQSGSMPDDISNDSLKEVVKFATTASSNALAHIMGVVNHLQDDELVHRSTSTDAPVLQLRGTPQAPDDTTGALSDTQSVASLSSFVDVPPNQIGK